MRIILAIPHMIVLWVLGIAAEVVALICWFAALFSGRLPDGLAEFQVGYLRWATRFYAYLFLLTDVYPPFELADAQYPVRLRAQPGPLNRLAVLFRIILVIPAWIVSALLGYGLSFLVMFVTWLIVLIAGRMPRPLHEALAAAVRYQVRVTGYFLMLTARYPGGLFGDPETSAFGAGPAGGVPGGICRAGGHRGGWSTEAPEASAALGLGLGSGPLGRLGAAPGPDWGRQAGGRRAAGPGGQPGAPAPVRRRLGRRSRRTSPGPGSLRPGRPGTAHPATARHRRDTASPGRATARPCRASPATQPGTGRPPPRSAGSAATSPGGWSCPARPSG